MDITKYKTTNDSLCDIKSIEKLYGTNNKNSISYNTIKIERTMVFKLNFIFIFWSDLKPHS